MLITTTNADTKLAPKRGYWCHPCEVKDGHALINALRAVAAEDGQSTLPSVIRSYEERAVLELAKKHARVLMQLISSNWYGSSAKAAHASVLKRTIDGLTYHLDHPMASSAVALVVPAADGGQETGKYRLAGVSYPKTLVKASAEVCSGGTAITTPWTIAVSLQLQRVSASRITSVTQRAETMQRIDQSLNKLNGQLSWATLFEALDFIDLGSYMAVPALPNSFERTSYLQAVTPAACAQAYAACTSAHAFSTAFAASCASALGYTTSEYQALLDKSPLAAPLTSDSYWTRASLTRYTSIPLAQNEFDLLTSRSAELLGVIPDLVRLTSPRVAFTDRGYASTILRYSQALSSLQGKQAYANDWSAVLDDPAPHTCNDLVERAFSVRPPTAASPASDRLGWDLLMGTTRLVLTPVSATPRLLALTRLLVTRPHSFVQLPTAALDAGFTSFSVSNSGVASATYMDGTEQKSAVINISFDTDAGSLCDQPTVSIYQSIGWDSLVVTARAYARLIELLSAAAGAGPNAFVASGRALYLLTEAQALAASLFVQTVHPEDVVFSPYVYPGDATQPVEEL